MTSREGAAGRAWENAVVLVAQGEGLLTADRKVKHGARDRGDLAGVEDVTGECKTQMTTNRDGRPVRSPFDWAGAVDEAMLEAVHNGTRYFAAFVKRRRKPPRLGYAVTTVGNYFALVRELLSLRARVAQLEAIVRALGGSPDAPTERAS